MQRVELCGGLDSLFSNATLITFSEINSDMRSLFLTLRDKYLQSSKPELFMMGEELRPGIMVLVDGVDAEVLVEEQGVRSINEVRLADDSTVTLISTLHGG